jgi:hypothetical protein
MPRCRFVQPNTLRYDLSDGDWIELKRELTAGERWSIDAAGLRERDEGGYDRDLSARSVAIRLGWLVNWSFIDPAGNQTKPSAETLTALDLPTIGEIDQAIVAHVEAQRAAKNEPSLGSDKA